MEDAAINRHPYNGGGNHDDFSPERSSQRQTPSNLAELHRLSMWAAGGGLLDVSYSVLASSLIALPPMTLAMSSSLKPASSRASMSKGRPVTSNGSAIAPSKSDPSPT